MEDEQPRRITRRTALKIIGGTGAAGAAVAVGPRISGWRLLGANDLAALRHASGHVIDPDLQVFLYRRDDLLTLRFDLYNLVLDTSGAAPVLTPSASPAWFVIVFPFQSIAEQCAIGKTNGEPSPLPSTPVETLASGPSQLAFEVPTSVTSIPFTVKGLLGWDDLDPLLTEVALKNGKANALDPILPVTDKTPPVTLIESAWRLFISPGVDTAWSSSWQPITNADGFTELWQARANPAKQSVPPPPIVAPTAIFAVWTPFYDYQFPMGDPSLGQPSKDPFWTSLSDLDEENLNRLGLVALSAGPALGGAITEAGRDEPRAQIALPGVPTPAKLLMLTPLGASTDIRGTYSNPAKSSIISWTHKMSIGRDTFVRVIIAGYLFPFGHRAVLIETTDREFWQPEVGDPVAYLVRRLTVQVTEPVTTYPYPDGPAQAWGNRQNPFVSLEIKTLVTPTIDPPSTSKPPGPPNVGSENPNTALWVLVDGTPFLFSFVGTDAEGRTVDFSSPVIWVNEAVGQSDVDTIGDQWNSSPFTSKPPSFNGQLMALAPTDDTNRGKTSLHLDSMTITAQPYKASGSWNFAPSKSFVCPQWYPVMDKAEVRLPAVQQLSPAAGDATDGPTVEYDPTYLENGFLPGWPEVFLDIKSAGPPLSFSQSSSTSAQTGTSQSGGMVSPNIQIDGISRMHGPVADTADLAAGKFMPLKFFGGALDAKILGAISLGEIIQEVSSAPAIEPHGGSPSAVSQVPQINTVPVYKKGQGPPNAAPIADKTTVFWTPELQPDSAGYFVPYNTTNGLVINVTLLTPLAPGSSPTSTIDGQLSNFDLVLFGDANGCIKIHFTSVQFSQRTGSKTQVHVNVDTVDFIGPLSWIEALETLFSSLGGPSIDVEPSGITASYTVSIPNIGLGVLSIENLSLGGSLTIPFTGQPVRLDVNFCTRENPFLLSIYIFTGGGWFLISLGADGIEMIEVGLEFGASVSLNIGVASGGVSIMAGIYFQLVTAPPPENITLTGFLKASGNLDVLGIISISVVFYLGFTYQSSTGDAYGTASVSVTVSVLCFSASVTLTVTKQIAGSDPPISFTDAISAADWVTYCESFR
ncbi:MAG: hypothetical protein ACLPQS_07875 [Acidimicrobiales bacterium]